MGFMSRAIPNLVNGVSQQPAVLRRQTQGEAQDNAFSSVVSGLIKRPPATHVAKLTADDLSAAFVHTIDRDSSERYKIFVDGDGVRVWDILTGTSKTVNYTDFTRTHLNAVAVTTTSTGRATYIPSGVTTITLTSTGLSTSDEIVWEKSSTGAFAGEETTVRTDTTDTDATVAWTSGDYVRAVYTRVTSTSVTASATYKSVDYLQDATKRQFKAVTVADYTFLVNTQITCAMSGVTDTARAPEAIINIKLPQSSTSFSVYVDGTIAAAYTSSATTPSSDAIATDLAADLVTNIGANYTITRFTNSNTIHLVRKNGADFTIRCEDSYGNRAMIGVKDVVQKFSDLPSIGSNGFVTKVAGDPDEGGDDYFVKYDDEGQATTGRWVETVEPGLDNNFDATTLPHSLVRQADGTFTFGVQTWAGRTVGDEITASQPSFIGRKINDIYFFRNRLGFLSDENVILSKQADFFVHWPATVVTLLDTDRIDVASSNNRVSILHHAIPYNEKLLLFSEKSQFVIDPGEVLSPRTVSVDQTTDFESAVDVRPVGLGRAVYFVQENGDYSRVRELFIDRDAVQQDAADVTGHVPEYIPANVLKMAGSSQDDYLVVQSDDEMNKLYVYKFLFGDSGSGGNSKLQSSWSRWILDSGDSILNADIIGNKIYLAISRSDGLYLETINMQTGVQDTGLGFLAHLDRKTSLTGSYDLGTDTTTWTLPYSDSGDFSVVLDANWTSEIGDLLTTTRPSATTIAASGDWSANTVIVGRKYNWLYTFSEQFVKQTKGSGEISIATGVLKLKTMSVSYSNTGYFTATVTPSNSRGSYVYPFTGVIVGQAVIGSVNTPTGTFRFPVGTRSSEVTITLENDSHLPTSILNAEWEGWFTLRTRRA